MSYLKLKSIETLLSTNHLLQSQTSDRQKTISTPPAHVTVLVVEFRPEFYASLEIYLQSAGIHIVHCTDGDNVSALVRRLDPSLILINAEQPAESGWLVCAKMRIQRTRNDVWIYTKRRSDFVRHWQRFSGADDVIFSGNSVEPIVRRLRNRMPQILRNPVRSNSTFEYANNSLVGRGPHGSFRRYLNKEAVR